MENEITLSEFSKLIAVNFQTVSKAIKQNKIPSQFAQKRGKMVYIQPKAATVTWLKNLQGTTTTTHELRKRLEAFVRTIIEEPEKEQQEQSITKTVQSPKVEKPGIPTYSESQNKERHFKAQLAELEYREKQGSLIDKAQAQFQLFTIGKEIRNSMLAIPDRIADDCFAAQNRAKLHSIIYEAIEFELTRIADLGNAL